MRRWSVVALCLIAFATHAHAQDFEMPTLRGTSPYIPASPKYTRWAGVYGGGQIGYVSSNMDFTDAFDRLNIFDSANLLTAPLGQVSSWAVLGRGDHHATSYGGFIGYNTQWDDAIIGIELNYNRTSLLGSSTDTRCYSDTNPQCLAAIVLGDTNTYNATVNATASARITDYGTLRARAGWAYGNFLPFATVGVAVARAQVTRSATVDATPTGAGTAFVQTESDIRNRLTWGYSVSGGMDFLVMPKVFVRGEYEFIQLNPVGDVKLSISTARAGIGLKF